MPSPFAGNPTDSWGERKRAPGYYRLPIKIGVALLALLDPGGMAERFNAPVLEAHPDDRAAIGLVATIDELFAIDAQAREQNLTVIERDQLRQQKARPILESIKSQIPRILREQPARICADQLRT
jgi:hypothetical protein